MTLPHLDAPRSHSVSRSDNALPDGDGRSPRMSPFHALGMLDASKGLAGQASLSNSTQRQNGISDNVSPSSSCGSAEDWYPREFGPIVHATYTKQPALAGSHNEYPDDDYLDDDSDKVGFYIQYVRRTGGGVSKTMRGRTVTAKDLLKICSTEGANVRVMMNGADPRSSPQPGGNAGGGEGRPNRRALADEMGPVDPDVFVDALYQHSRERERGHFFIDNDGEIRRLYHMEGWHQLRTPGRRRHSSGRRPGSGESHRGHKSSRGSGTEGSRQSLKGNPSPPASPRGNGGSTSRVQGVQSADDVGGAVPMLRNTRYGSAGSLFTAERYAATNSPSHQQPQPQPTHVPQSTRAAQSSSPQSETPPGLYRHPSSNISGTTTSIGSGRSSTLPGSRGPTDFYAEAFGAQNPRVSPILVHPDGDFASGHPAAAAGGGILRRSSMTSLKYEVDADGKGADGESATLSPRRQSSMRAQRRVSFSRDTQYFKKDSFYVTPRHEKDSEYTDLTPPQGELKAPSANAAAEPTNLALPSLQLRKPSHGSHPQLTLLKDKMSQNRDRDLY